MRVAFRRAVLDWFEVARRRDLPWRTTRDPWAVLVAEAMLQQTQVSRVVPRYEGFLEVFPTPRRCAEAPLAEVIRRWDGLGYNRRAVHLHAAARAIVDRHGGRVPDDLDALLALPGVGPYTARAVLAFAFERDHGVLDTNAARVLARAVSGEPMTRSAAQSLADDLVPGGQAWTWNQAVLDLGATVCTKRSPRCGACPVVGDCRWAAAGWPSPDPAEATAGSSATQAPFEGSDRQGRGRLIDALRCAPLSLDLVPDVAGWPEQPERARRVADALVKDGLAEVVDGMLVLPA